MEAMQVTSARVAPQDLAAFCLEAMRVSGLNEEDARLTAEVLVTTDTWGTFTHGTRQLRGLMKNVRLGAVDPAAIPEVTGEGPSWALVDAHAAMPPASAYQAMQIAIEKARSDRSCLRRGSERRALWRSGLLCLPGRTRRYDRPHDR